MSAAIEQPLISPVENTTLVESSFTATINAPIELIDIPEWCFSPPDSEYQACSPAHLPLGPLQPQRVARRERIPAMRAGERDPRRGSSALFRYFREPLGFAETARPRRPQARRRGR